MTPAQDPDTEVGEILRLTLDGKPAPGNPMAGRRARPSSVDQSAARYGRGEDRARDQHVHGRGAEPGARGDVDQRSSDALRLAFAPDGRLWEVEHGPRGGDELNLIEPGKNYGWPLVGDAPNYRRRAGPRSRYAP